MNRGPKRRVPFFLHDLGAPELAQVAEVLKGEILTTGEYVGQFERKLADYLGRKHVLAVSSCTGALHLSLLGLGIGPGDEVITTPMTFIATATAILEAGATPVFVDVEPDTGNLNADLVEAAITPRTKAIMPVHLYGLMCDMRALRSIANRRGLKIIEDSAHCVEAKRDGSGQANWPTPLASVSTPPRTSPAGKAAPWRPTTLPSTRSSSSCICTV
jgi:dTDP-4-amino-4,6-dideoxygalactose transaminase